MPKRSVWSQRLSLLCLLAVALPVSITAQDYPPNGPKIPPIALTGGGAPPPEQPPPPGPRDQNSAWNTELVGHNDLQGRSAYQPIIINQDGRHITYVGHHNRAPILNPLTGKEEVNGTSIVDVTDPANTVYLAHIPTGTEPGTGGAQMVQVCSGSVLPKGVPGKWRVYAVTDGADQRTFSDERTLGLQDRALLRIARMAPSIPRTAARIAARLERRES